MEFETDGHGVVGGREKGKDFVVGSCNNSGCPLCERRINQALRVGFEEAAREEMRRCYI